MTPRVPEDVSLTSLPDGYTDVPRGKIAAVVTSLEMLAPPAPSPERGAAPWRLREVSSPDPDFGVVPELIGKGAGRWLMARALERAWRPGIERVWLHTCTLDHPSAVPFYVRSGFTPYERRVEVADDPRLTGVLPPGAAPGVPLLR